MADMLACIIHAFEGLFTIVFVIAVGFALGRRGWIDDGGSAMLARLVTNVAMPCYLFVGIMKNFTLERLAAFAPEMLLPACSMLLAMAAGGALTRLLRIRRGRRAIFGTNCFISNTVFIGLPVNLALFGDESIPAVMLYYIVNTFFFWSVGAPRIADEAGGHGAPCGALGILKKILSPPLMGFFAALLLVGLGASLPKPLYQGLHYVGSLTTPLSLIFIGVEISRISLRAFRMERDLVWGLAGRFIVSPLCLFAVLPFFDAAPLSVRVFTMQAAMPAMTQMAIVAKRYGADSRYAAELSFITILFALAAIPVYMILAQLYL